MSLKLVVANVPSMSSCANVPGRRLTPRKVFITLGAVIQAVFSFLIRAVLAIVRADEASYRSDGTEDSVAAQGNLLSEREQA